MPTKRMLLERLKHDVEVKGEGDHNCFFEDVTVSQAERIKNGKRKEKFVLVTGDPDLCARLEGHKDRIFRKVRNKAFMLTLMERAWAEALADTELDKILAAEEVES
jgi:hypothetical protein